MRTPRSIALVGAGLVAVLVSGCAEDARVTGVALDEHELTRSVDGCEPGTPQCAWVKLRWLDASEGPDVVVQAVDDWIRARLLEPLGDHWTVQGPEDIVTSLFADRADFLAEFPDAATAGWYLEREIRRLPATAEVVSLEFTERQYSGGAHGMEMLRLVSFDARTGAVLGLADLVPADERGAFRGRAERAFRKQRGLAPDVDLRNAGFFVEQNALPVTDNVALVRDGIRLHYDAYEIAPYAMGPTDLVVPR